MKWLIGLFLVFNNGSAVPQMIQPEIYNQDQVEITCRQDKIITCSLEPVVVIKL